MLNGKSSGVHDITFQEFEMDGNFDNRRTISWARVFYTTIENNVFDNAGCSAIFSGSNCDGNYFSSNFYTTIKNNIFINTRYVAGRAIEIYDTHQHLNVFYNDFYANKVNFYGYLTTQSNNYFVDPKFADTTNHDYHLSATSPCIGAGLNGEDIGAYIKTIQLPKTDSSISIPIAKFTATPVSITFTDTSSGNETFRLWDFGDGSTSTKKTVNYTFISGTYTVKLTVWNAAVNTTKSTMMKA